MTMWRQEIINLATPPPPQIWSNVITMMLKRLMMLTLAVLTAGIVIYCFVELFDKNPIGSRYSPTRQVNLEESDENRDKEVSTDTFPQTPLRVAVAPVISPEKSLKFYQGFLDYLGEALGEKTVLLQRQSYAEVNNLIRHGGCDIAFICAYPFVQGERDFGLEALVIPQINGKITYRSFIIVPRQSTAASLLDLRGKRFASSDFFSNSGWLFPAVWLLQKGMSPEDFFAEHVVTGSHDRSVMAVATGYIDGAAVHSVVYEQMVLDNPSIMEKTRIIMKSPSFGMPPVVAKPKMDPVLKERVLNVLLGMHTTPEGKEKLAALGFERFLVPDIRIYDSVRKAAALWEMNR